MTTIRHWRQMIDSKTLGVGDIPEDVTDWTLRIAKIDAGKVSYADGPTKKPLITFEGVQKPLAAGATVMTQIASLYGTDTPSKMVGKLVTLYAAKTDSYGKKNVDCIRVRPRIPKPADLWGAPYDHASALAQISAAADLAELEDVRAAIGARRPASEFHASLKAAVGDATARINAATTAPTEHASEEMFKP